MHAAVQDRRCGLDRVPHPLGSSDSCHGWQTRQSLAGKLAVQTYFTVMEKYWRTLHSWQAANNQANGREAVLSHCQARAGKKAKAPDWDWTAALHGEPHLTKKARPESEQRKRKVWNRPQQTSHANCVLFPLITPPRSIAA